MIISAIIKFSGIVFATVSPLYVVDVELGHYGRCLVARDLEERWIGYVPPTRVKVEKVTLITKTCVLDSTISSIAEQIK